MKQLFVCAAIMCAASTASAQGWDAYRPLDVSSSSTLKGKADKYAAWRVFDADASPDSGMDMEGPALHMTAWCEGKKDQGVGEYLEIGGSSGVSVSKIEIAAGFWKSEKLYKQNNRPTRLIVTLTDYEGQEQTSTVAVPDGLEYAVLDFGQSMGATSIRIQFDQVTKGKMNDTCISDLVLWDGDNRVEPFLSTGTALQELMGTVTTLAEGFEKCDQAQLDGLIKFPFSYKSLPDPTGETKPVKKKYKKMKDLLRGCAKGDVPYYDSSMDYVQLTPEGFGKVKLRAAGGNEMGSPWWHLSYDMNPDGGGGVWKITNADAGFL